MTQIIKFPEHRSCDDCAQPLDPGEGQICPVDGCDNLVCDYCLDVSGLCVEHMTEEIRREQALSPDGM